MFPPKTNTPYPPYIATSHSVTQVYYVQVELDPEKQLKIKSGFFLTRVNISANQMISGDSKCQQQTCAVWLHYKFGKGL